MIDLIDFDYRIDTKCFNQPFYDGRHLYLTSTPHFLSQKSEN